MGKCGPVTHEPRYTQLEESEDAEGIWVDPVGPELITGDLKIWAFVALVRPIRIPGYLYHRKLKENEVTSHSTTPAMPQKTVYSLHGGGYISGTAHPSGSYASICRALLEETDLSVKSVFALEYRLSSTFPLEPSNPFPAALLDALAGYNYLVNVRGIPTSDIIIEGDSAGGNLALALTRYLVEHSGLPNLPPSPNGPSSFGFLLRRWTIT
ncbi:hypothetical protein MPER_03971 [Moniliophthora perniciosa FA553]|nr:hypothetical protein MPER_03971 [Moniliophthora perniciosa FA553]